MGFDVTIVEFLSGIGGAGIDEEMCAPLFIFQFSLFLSVEAYRLIRKQFQKSLTGQGLKFELSKKGPPQRRKTGR